MVLAGIVVAMSGIFGILYCALIAFRAKRSIQDDQEFTDQLGRLIPWNMAWLFVSTIGLALVVIGLIL